MHGPTFVHLSHTAPSSSLRYTPYKHFICGRQTLTHDREDDVFERIYKKWFALDGVYFDRGHVALLAEKTTPVFYTESRSRVPYTPWFPTHYIYVGTKTK